MRIRLTESKLRNLIREAIVNEVSQQTKAQAYVKANNDLKRLRQMKKDGQHQFRKNGRMVDTADEISRRERQMGTFGNGLARDLANDNNDLGNNLNNIENIRSEINRYKKVLSPDYDKFKDKDYPYVPSKKLAKQRIAELEKQLKNALSYTGGYRVHTGSGEDGYHIDYDGGGVYSTPTHDSLKHYSDNSRKNMSKMDRLKGVTDAMMGYDDEISGATNKEINSLRRRQDNVQALRDYDVRLRNWQEQDDQIRRAQSEYDRMSPLNPKKWFSKRPADGPAKPEHPKWTPNEKGEFDGYFQPDDPKAYNKWIGDQQDRQQRYKDARSKYFG